MLVFSARDSSTSSCRWLFHSIPKHTKRTSLSIFAFTFFAKSLSTLFCKFFSCFCIMTTYYHSFDPIPHLLAINIWHNIQHKNRPPYQVNLVRIVWTNRRFCDAFISTDGNDRETILWCAMPVPRHRHIYQYFFKCAKPWYDIDFDRYIGHGERNEEKEKKTKSNSWIHEFDFYVSAVHRSVVYGKLIFYFA